MNEMTEKNWLNPKEMAFLPNEFQTDVKKVLINFFFNCHTMEGKFCEKEFSQFRAKKNCVFEPKRESH